MYVSCVLVVVVFFCVFRLFFQIFLHICKSAAIP
nr:MAG TPA: hypothetical protein [Caudoviricetes sp.]